ncbi:POK18 protein, partial [Podilymbus podiceps]|nr:POK18 protein [Podilymbus podiceps]
VQKLMGSLNWIRPYLGLTSSQLQPLLELLKHSSDPNEPQQLTKKAKRVLEVVEQKIDQLCQQTYDISQELQIFVLIDKLIPFSALVQQNHEWSDLLHVL